MWFSYYSEYAANPFFVTGESFAGHYVPSITYKILDENAHPSRPVPGVRRKVHINLRGSAIGDGVTDLALQAESYAEFAYANGLVATANYKKALKHQAALKAAADRGDKTTAINEWGVISELCLENAGGVNVYNIRDYVGYDQYFDFSTKFLNHKPVKDALHVGDVDTWQACSGTVHKALLLDVAANCDAQFGKTLDDGYHWLIYNGLDDFIVAKISQDRWLERVQWRHTAEWLAASHTPWILNNEVVGFTKAVGTLTLQGIRNSGHLVPHDVPEVSEAMMDRFIKDALGKH